MSWIKNVAKINLLSMCSISEFLITACYEFFMILVSWPEYTTMPMTHSVFLSVDPRRMN